MRFVNSPENFPGSTGRVFSLQYLKELESGQNVDMFFFLRIRNTWPIRNTWTRYSTNTHHDVRNCHFIRPTLILLTSQ